MKMFENDFVKGCNVFSTGKSILLNWNKHSLIVETPMLTDVITDKRCNREVRPVYDERLRSVVKKPINHNKITLTFSCSDIISKNEPINFSEILQKDITVEEMLRLAYKKGE